MCAAGSLVAADDGDHVELRRECSRYPPCAQSVDLDDAAFGRMLRVIGYADEGQRTATALLRRVYERRGLSLPYCGAAQFISVRSGYDAVCACNGDGAAALFSGKDVFHSCDARTTDGITDTLLLALTFVIVFQSMSAAMNFTGHKTS
jgi:hypothetical protein